MHYIFVSVLFLRMFRKHENNAKISGETGRKKHLPHIPSSSAQLLVLVCFGKGICIRVMYLMVLYDKVFTGHI